MKPPKMPLPDVPPEKMAEWEGFCKEMVEAKNAASAMPLPATIQECQIVTAIVGCWLGLELHEAGCPEDVIEEICQAFGQASAAAMDVANPWDLAQSILADWRSTGDYPRPGKELADALRKKYGLTSGHIELLRYQLHRMFSSWKERENVGRPPGFEPGSQK